MFFDQIPMVIQVGVGVAGSLLSTRNIVLVSNSAKPLYTLVWIVMTVSFLSIVLCALLGQIVPNYVYLSLVTGLFYLMVKGTGNMHSLVPESQRTELTYSQRKLIGLLVLGTVPTTIVAHDIFIIAPETPVRYSSFRNLTDTVVSGEDAYVEVVGIKNRDDCDNTITNLWFAKNRHILAEIRYSSQFLPTGPFSAKIARPTQGIDSRNISYKIPTGEAYMQTKITYDCKGDERHVYWSPLMPIKVLPPQ